jgi:hypothetical protein
MAGRPRPWRVRTRRLLETWVDVTAHTKEEAETLAASLPQVMSVFTGSAVRADLKETQPKDVGVEDE